MKPGLLKSFIILAIFWNLVAWITFGLADPDVNLRVYTRMAHLLPFLHLAVPSHISVLDAAGIQYRIARYWTAPLLGVVAVTTLLGVAAAWGYAFRIHLLRAGREKGHGEWRGVTLTKGVLPLPEYMKRVHVDLEFVTDEARSLFDRLPAVERDLLLEIIETIAAYPEAFPGDGHGVSLLVHTLNVLERLILAKPDEPLALVAAAAHDLGKVTAFQRNKEGKWERVKLHDRESARILALLPSYWKIDITHRRALAMAIKYGHAESLVPQVTPDIDRLAATLASLVHAADGTATKEEKQRLLETKDLPELVLTSFLDALPSIAFQSPGLPRGVKAVGWKKGNRLYLIEHQIRDQALARMDPDVKAAIGGAYRKKTVVAPFTLELLKALEARGWLVHEIGEAKLPVNEAFWDIKAGERQFNAIIIIDVPAEVLDRLPSQDTIYPLSVLSPHFKPPGITSSADIDLDGAGVFSAPKKKKKLAVPQVDTTMPVVTRAGSAYAARAAVNVDAPPDAPVASTEPVVAVQPASSGDVSILPDSPSQPPVVSATVENRKVTTSIKHEHGPSSPKQPVAPAPMAEKQSGIGKKDADMAFAAAGLLRDKKNKD
jgi:hypothetical protein